MSTPPAHRLQDGRSRSDSSASFSSRDQSPTRQTGITHLSINGTSQARSKEGARSRKGVDKSQPTESTSKGTATPARSKKKKANIPSTASDSALESANANTAVSSTDQQSVPASTPTPKNKKKVVANNNNTQSQASQQKNRKASRTAPADIATPAKKQEYYAGPAFANSPAASSLPIPKFFLRQEAAKAAGDSPRSASASPALHDPAVTTSRSGLDLLFDAHRKEKAGKQSDSSDPSSAITRPDSSGYSGTQNNHTAGLTEDAWRDFQSQQLKDLLAGKPSTPERSSAPPSLKQHMSAPPQFQTRPQGPSSSGVSRNNYQQQPDNYYYGNRHLSPMFEAARQGAQSDSSPSMNRSVDPQHYQHQQQQQHHHHQHQHLRPQQQPLSFEEHTYRNPYPQYSPNPPKTSPYLPAATNQNHGPLPPPPPQQQQHLHEQAAKSQKEDAIRKMIGMK